MIQVDNITKSYRKLVVLSSISGVFPSGKITCIVGENGSGKSTLFSILAGVLRPDSGSVSYGIENTPPLESRVALLPQKDQLFSHLTVKNNLDFWLAANDPQNPKEELAKTIKILNLEKFLKKPVHTLSGGMARRVAIATALIGNPRYILLDEPFSGLDLLHKRELAEYFKEISSKGTTIVYSAHNIDEVHIMANVLFAIREGKMTPLSLPSSLDELHVLITDYIKGGTTNGR